MQRARYNPMATIDRPRWLKVYDYLGNVLSSRRIEPGTNLVQVIEAESARWQADGWVVESDAAARAKWGNFFMNRNGVRRMVAIVPVEVPVAGHSTMWNLPSERPSIGTVSTRPQQGYTKMGSPNAG